MIGNKEYGNLCKSHSARSEKEFCRVCPSKLTKKELENVYFSLLEENLDLKRTINTQNDKIKVLSTKIQRLSAVQKTYLGKEPKECCGSKAVIKEQNECISELQRANRCMSERVRQLNMRLCSAKQFLKRSPFQSTSRCNRCSHKNASMSALILKRSESNLKNAVTSHQYLDKDFVSSRTVDNDIVSHEKGVQYDFCEENKCRTHIEELKQQNEDLHQALSKAHEDLASLQLQYEDEVLKTRTENARARAERTRADELVLQLRSETSTGAKKLAVAEMRCDELLVELSIEKRKVLEAEMRVKAAEMSCRIANAIEAHLTSIKAIKDPATNTHSSLLEAAFNERAYENESPRLTVPSPPYKPTAAVRTKVSRVPLDEVFKNSDDSGYTEVNRSPKVSDNKASTYINQVLLEKVADLQNQINTMKMSKVYNTSDDITSESHQYMNTGITRSNNLLTDEIQTIPCTMEENAISESSDSVVTEKKLNINTIQKVIDKTDENKDNSNKQTVNSQPIDNVNSPRVTSESEITKTGLEGKVENEKTEHDVTYKRKESYKQFKKRSKDKNDAEIGRTLSLESSRDFPDQKNLLKTGSLDENKIVDAGTKNIVYSKSLGIKTEDTTPKSNNNIQTRDSDTDFNTNMSNSKNVVSKSDKSIVDTKASKKDITENTISVQISDAKTNIEDRNSLNLTDTSVKASDNTTDKANVYNKEKNSDSSKGTYSIHKDDIEKNIETVDRKQRNIKHRKIKKASSLTVENSKIRDTDVKTVLNNASKDRKSDKRRSSTPSQPRTYVIPGKGVAKSTGLSPDSTECEISSMSDLPSERNEKHRRGYRSPGEDRMTTTVTESRTDTTTTDYGSLSEGELPCVESTLSAGEMRAPHRTFKSNSLPLSTSQQMEDALTAVKEELWRCTNLLKIHSMRSLESMQDLKDRQV